MRRVTDPSSATPDGTLVFLKASIANLLGEIQARDEWKKLTATDADPRRVGSVLREIYREIALYQPDVIEATIQVIGQFPRSLDAKFIRTMLIHQAEEWDHGEMAVRDFAAMGGDEAEVREAAMTPTAFATAAFWRMLAHRRLPFAYLGALYLFEGLTPVVTGLLRNTLSSRGLASTGMEYIDFHATEDIRHAKIVDHLILEVLERFPDRAPEVEFGFRAFQQVYPLPGWIDAVRRAGGEKDEQWRAQLAK